MDRAVYDCLARLAIVSDYVVTFRKATGVWLRLLPAGGVGQHFWPASRQNPFCSLVQKSAGGCEACLKTHAELQRRTSEKLSWRQARCFAGLTDVAVPVVVTGKHAAMLCSGQVFLRKPAPADFAGVAKLLDHWGCRTDLPRAREAFFQTPVVAPERFRAMVRLLVFFAKQLGDSANGWMIAGPTDSRPCVSAAVAFAQRNASGSLKMRDAAQHVHLSPVYFCRLFKKTAGMPFTEYVSRLRVEKAKQLLSDPFTRVGEAGYACGFGSAQDFDRVFKKYTGMAPKEYQRSSLPDVRSHSA